MIKSTKACFKTGISPSSLNFLVSRSRREGEAEERSEIPSFHQVFLGSGTTVISSLGFYNKISHTHEGTLFDSFLDLRKNILEVVSHNFDHYQQGETTGKQYEGLDRKK